MADFPKSGSIAPSVVSGLGVRAKGLGLGVGAGSSSFHRDGLLGGAGSAPGVVQLAVDGCGERSEPHHAGTATSEYVDKLISHGVVSFDAVQTKNRFQGDEPGIVEASIRTRKDLLAMDKSFSKQWYKSRFGTLSFSSGNERVRLGEWARVFKSAEAAWEALQSKRERIVGEYLRRLREALPGCHVFLTKEPHPGKKHGRSEHKGWPHIHFIIWYKKGQRFDYEKLQPLWGWGICRFEIPRGGCAEYCCKYLVNGWKKNAWLMHLGWYIHFHGTTHGCRRAAGLIPPVRKPSESPPVPRVGPKTVGEGLALGDRFLRTLMRYELPGGGKGFMRFQCRLGDWIKMMEAKGALGGYIMGGGHNGSGRAEMRVCERSERNLVYSVELWKTFIGEGGLK